MKYFAVDILNVFPKQNQKINCFLNLSKTWMLAFSPIPPLTRFSSSWSRPVKSCTFPQQPVKDGSPSCEGLSDVI